MNELETSVMDDLMEFEDLNELDDLVYEAPARGYPRSEKTKRLRVRFKTDYCLFRRQVERAIGRFTIYRSDQGQRARAHVVRHEYDYQTIHLEQKLLGRRDDERMAVCVKLIYEGPKNRRRVVDVIPC